MVPPLVMDLFPFRHIPLISFFRVYLCVYFRLWTRILIAINWFIYFLFFGQNNLRLLFLINDVKLNALLLVLTTILGNSIFSDN